MLLLGRRRPPPDELDRLRRPERPKRPPLRILIASDPQRPVRTVVIPRLLPWTVGITGAVLLLLAAGSSLSSLRLGRSVDRLQGRMAAMVNAAETVARHPLGGAVSGAAGRGAALHMPSGDPGRFVVQSVNTGEQVEVKLDLATGEVEAQSYRQLRRLLRCLRTGAETPIDPRLVELLFRIAERTGQKIELVSGFRAPMFSTADLSYHTRGMAADIRIPGMTPLMVRDLVNSMGVKGIGYYPVSQFVHVDVRDQRAQWTDYGSKRDDGEGAEHGADPSAPR